MSIHVLIGEEDALELQWVLEIYLAELRQEMTLVPPGEIRLRLERRERTLLRMLHCLSPVEEGISLNA